MTLRILGGVTVPLILGTGRITVDSSSRSRGASDKGSRGRKRPGGLKDSRTPTESPALLVMRFLPLDFLLIL